MSKDITNTTKEPRPSEKSKSVEKYRLVLGLEIHMHVKTSTKMFCGCNANIYGEAPNTHTCPVCLGLPGALPVPNYQAVEKVQLMGKALNCELLRNSKFDRKHYFYPDLGKSYQISQYKEPLCGEGYVDLEEGRVEIERIHLEEDTAKSFHKDKKTLLDFNKSGMPLMELVTKPIFHSVSHAVEFCKQIQDLARTLNVSDGDMEKGQMRLEANISMQTPKQAKNNDLPSYKVEVKNINSFRFMEKAVLAEIKRQSEMLDKGETPRQENRGFDEDKNVTVLQRDKENAHDYRYFPEPDIPPMVFTQEHLDYISSLLPELPHQIIERLTKYYGLPAKSAEQLSLSTNADLLKKFEALVKRELDPTVVANLLLNKLEYRDLSIDDFIKKQKQDSDVIKDVKKVTPIVTKVLDSNASAVKDYKNGKESALQFLLGMVMRESKGKADPTISLDILKEKLAS